MTEGRAGEEDVRAVRALKPGKGRQSLSRLS